jgi:hypothetical protein
VFWVHCSGGVPPEAQALVLSAAALNMAGDDVVITNVGESGYSVHILNRARKKLAGLCVIMVREG